MKRRPLWPWERKAANRPEVVFTFRVQDDATRFLATLERALSRQRVPI